MKYYRAVRDRWQEGFLTCIAVYAFFLLLWKPENWHRWLLFGLATYGSVVAFYCGSYARNNKVYKDENEKHKQLNQQQKETQSKLEAEVDELHRIENELTQSLEELSKIKTILHQWGGPDGDAQKIVENINETHRRFLQQQDKVSLRRIFEMICCRKDVLEMYPEDFERFAKMVSKDKRLGPKFRNAGITFEDIDEAGNGAIDLAEFETLAAVVADTPSGAFNSFVKRSK
jgi:hypothetical protein